MQVGILGGGQLAQMLALSGAPLGVVCRCLDPSPDACAGQITELVVAPFENHDAARQFAGGCDVVTYEWEGVPAATAAAVSEVTRVDPGVQALRIAQDRLDEKTFFTKLDIATAKFASANSPDELAEGAKALGYPSIAKTRRGGYDGKGQIAMSQPNPSAWQHLGEQPLIVEERIAFDRELSVIAVRAQSGEMATYPVVENRHLDGILSMTIAPAPHLDAEVEALAIDYVTRIANALDYVGVLSLELFQVGRSLFANELAPRVHNSGHWTIEGAATSQFENHLRAILDWPLGDTSAFGAAVMLNCIGKLPAPQDVLAFPGVHFHDYGKQARPRRKLGHITISGSNTDALMPTVEKVHRLVAGW